MTFKQTRRGWNLALFSGTVVAFLCAVPAALAANKYWDTSTSANLQFGDGSWDVGTTALWSTGAAGSNPLVTWANGDDAWFQAVGTSQITVNGAVSAKSLNFDASGAITKILAGTGTLTLTGNITAFWNNGGSSTTNQISSSLVLGSNSTITFQRNYGDGTNGNFLLIDGVISGAYKLSVAQTSSTGGGGNGTLWLNNGANSFSGGLDAGGRYIYTTATSGTPFGTGDITTRVGYDTTPVVPIYLSPSGSGADVSLSAANATATTKININGGGLFVLNKGSNNSLTFTAGNAGAAANSVINRVGARDALTIQYTNTLGTDEKFIVNGGVTVNNGMVTPYISGLKGTTDDFLTYDGTAGFQTVTYDKTNTFSGADNTSKVLLTGNLAPGADAAAYALNLRSGTLDMGGNTLAMGNGTDPAGLLIRGTISNGKVTSAGDLVVTSNGGAINASVEGAGTLAASGAGALKLGGDVKIANLSAGAATIDLSASGAQVLNAVVTITSGKLAKSGAGTTTFSSAGNSIYSTEITNGKLVLDNSVAANPSVNLTSTGDSLIAKGGTFQMDAGTLNLAGRLRISPDGVNGYGAVKIMGGTVNQTASYIDMGYNSGRALLVVGGTATFNASGRDVSISTAWNGNSFVNIQDTASATFGNVTVAGSNGVGGTSMYGTLSISGSAALTATRLLVGQQSSSATAATYGQVNQDGGTTTINGYVSMAENQTSGVLQGVINLKGGTLKVQDRIYGGTGKSYVNFHGGTLTYTGAAAKSNFFNLGVNGKAYLYESSTIDTGSQNVTIDQALLSPNSGKGVTSVAITNGGSGYTVAPSVTITGGEGEGATAVAVLDENGTITEIRITNPGTGYTSAPIVALDRGYRVGGADAVLGTVTVADNAFTGGLTKMGAGTLTLNGASTFTGDTVVGAGTLTLANSLALQNSVLHYNSQGGVISFGSLTSATMGGLKGAQDLPAAGLTSLTLNPGSGSVAYSGVIANGTATLALTKTGAGTQELSGANIYGGNTTISAGTLRAGADNTLPSGTGKGNVVLDSGATAAGTLDLNDKNLAINGLSGNGTSAVLGQVVNNAGTGVRNLTVGNGDASATFAGTILDNAGSGGKIALIKAGSGTQTLAGSNTFTGGTTINGGILAVSGGAALADDGAVTLADAAGAALRLDSSETIGSLEGGGATGGNVNLQANTLTVANAADKTFSGAMSGAGGKLIKQGAGKMSLAGASTYDGGTEVRNGTLALAGGSLADGGSVHVNGSGARFDLGGGSDTVGAVTLTDGQINNGTLTGSGFTVKKGSVGANLAGLGASLIKDTANTVTLSGANSYGGGTMVNAGTLVVGGSISSGATVKNTATLVDNGSIGGAVTVENGGTLKGSGTLSGTTTIAAGGTLSPGNSPGQLTHESGLSLANGSTYVWELISNDIGVAGTDYDQELITGGNLTVDIGATLSLVFNSTESNVDWGSTFWADPHQWLMMDFSGTGTSSGNFGTVNVSTDSGGNALADVRADGAFVASRVGNNLYVNYVIPEPGTAGILLLGLTGVILRRRTRVA